MENNYLINVFVGGKSVNSFFAEDLDCLMTMKAVYGNCDISVCDVVSCKRLTREQVAYEIQASYRRWKKSMAEPPKEEPEVPQKRKKKDRPIKIWERPLLCVETGKKYKSIRDCSDAIGIPYMTIANCVRRGNATRGLHFEEIKKEDVQEIGSK